MNRSNWKMKPALAAGSVVLGLLVSDLVFAQLNTTSTTTGGGGGGGGGNVTVIGSLPAGANNIGGVNASIMQGGNTAAVTAASALKVDGSAVTQPVSGSVSANVTQTGTWTVQPGNTANTTPWLTTLSQGGNTASVTAANALKIDGSAVTQPVKASSESATAATVPGNAIYMGGVSSGILTGIVACDTSTTLVSSTIATTQIVAAVAGKIIYVCSYAINGGGTTSAKLLFGTGANCATAPADITPFYKLAINSTISQGSGLGYLAKTTAGSALCASNSAAVNVNFLVTYTQF